MRSFIPWIGGKSQIVNLFRCIRFHRGELQCEISGYINAREVFEDIRAQIDMRDL